MKFTQNPEAYKAYKTSRAKVIDRLEWHLDEQFVQDNLEHFEIWMGFDPEDFRDTLTFTTGAAVVELMISAKGVDLAKFQQDITDILSTPSYNSTKFINYLKENSLETFMLYHSFDGMHEWLRSIYKGYASHELVLLHVQKAMQHIIDAEITTLIKQHAISKKIDLDLYDYIEETDCDMLENEVHADPNFFKKFIAQERGIAHRAIRAEKFNIITEILGDWHEETILSVSKRSKISMDDDFIVEHLTDYDGAELAAFIRDYRESIKLFMAKDSVTALSVLGAKAEIIEANLNSQTTEAQAIESQLQPQQADTAEAAPQVLSPMMERMILSCEICRFADPLDDNPGKGLQRFLREHVEDFLQALSNEQSKNQLIEAIGVGTVNAITQYLKDISRVTNDITRSITDIKKIGVSCDKINFDTNYQDLRFSIDGFLRSTSDAYANLAESDQKVTETLKVRLQIFRKFSAIIEGVNDYFGPDIGVICYIGWRAYEFTATAHCCSSPYIEVIPSIDTKASKFTSETKKFIEPRRILQASIDKALARVQQNAEENNTCENAQKLDAVVPPPLTTELCKILDALKAKKVSFEDNPLHQQVAVELPELRARWTSVIGESEPQVNYNNNVSLGASGSVTYTDSENLVFVVGNAFDCYSDEDTA